MFYKTPLGLNPGMVSMALLAAAGEMELAPTAITPEEIAENLCRRFPDRVKADETQTKIWRGMQSPVAEKRRYWQQRAKDAGLAIYGGELVNITTRQVIELPERD